MKKFSLSLTETQIQSVRLALIINDQHQEELGRTNQTYLIDTDLVIDMLDNILRIEHEDWEGKFRVFNNNVWADEIGYPSLKNQGWTTSIFDSFSEAQRYAKLWLGTNCEEIALELDKEYDYSGHGDMIRIRKVSTT